MASVRMAGGRRLGAVLAVGGLLATLLTFGGAGPVQAQTVPDFPGTANFSAHATGTGLHADVIDAGAEGPRVVDAEVGFSSAAINTGGLDAGVVNEMNMPVVPVAGVEDIPVDSGGKEAYGKGSGVEVGLGNSLPNLEDANQLKLTQVAAASEPPAVTPDVTQVTPGDSASTGLVQTELLAVPGGPLLYADVTQTRAGAVWSNRTCIVGQPLAVGEGTIADAELLGTADDGETDALEGALVELDSEAGDEVIDTQSFTYLIANKNPDGTPDGTYGVVSETRMILAPITIAEDATNGLGALQINVAGTWFLRVTATGKGPATVQYGIDNSEDFTNETPVLQVLAGGELQGQLLFQDLFGEEGLNLPPELEALLEISIGEDPRAIAAPDSVPDDTAPPVTTVTDGAAAVDVVRVGLLQPDAPAAGVSLAGVRVGHMEAKVNVPEGGFRCRFPVSKTLTQGGNTVTTGNPFEFTIRIPSDSNALDGLACDIVAIRAFDELRNNTAGARLTGSTPEGVISNNGQRIDWANLGSYQNGQPPIEVKVQATASRGGSFENVVEAFATLGNCDGGGLLTGDALASFLQGAGLVGEGAVTGGAQIQGTGTTGALGVQVLAQALPATGLDGNNLYIGLAVAALLSAAGVYRLTRKAQPTS
jgi:hypothetical protein